MSRSVSDALWPGPVPLRPDRLSSAMPLVGREREMAELLTVVRDGYHVVQMTGATGVGKSSFLNVARARLEQELPGTILPPRLSWAELLTVFDRLPVRLRRQHGARSLYCLALGAEPAGTVSDALAQARAGDTGRVVIVLDQFEELLRYRPALAEQLLHLVAVTARDEGVTHIVAARAEYAYLLRPVEGVLRTSTWHISLCELKDEAVLRRVIGESGGVEVADAAMERMLEWWQTALEEGEPAKSRSTLTPVPAAGGGDLGLLHLQSLLWLLKTWAGGSPAHDGPTLTEEMLTLFAEHHLEPEGAGAKAGPALIRRAMVDYVEHALLHATETVETEWAVGVPLMLARVAPYLSTGGYKVPQALSSLLVLALRDELDATQARKLAMSPSLEPAKMDEDFPVPGAGAAADERSVTSELAKCLQHALDHLAEPEVNILHRFQHRGDWIYELVHDGMGRPLEDWAGDFLDGPIAMMGLLTPRSGLPLAGDQEHGDAHFSPETFDSRGPEGRLWGAIGTERGADDTPRSVLQHLRWWGNRIRLCHFRDIIFDNCRFDGSYFERVTFENVEFRSCQLRGVVMRDCTFKGVQFTDAARPGDGEKGHSIDTFTLENVDAMGEVVFDGLPKTTGLFLWGIAGGNWRFRGFIGSHVVISGRPDGASVVLRFEEGCRVSHLTLAPGLQGKFRKDPTSHIDSCSNDAGMRLPDGVSAGPWEQRA